jgi:hypothetical protein
MAFSCFSSKRDSRPCSTEFRHNSHLPANQKHEQADEAENISGVFLAAFQLAVGNTFGQDGCAYLGKVLQVLIGVE